MIDAIRRLLGAWRGDEARSATVPPMDGVLSPNQAIEEAPVLLDIEAPDNLVCEGSRILFSSAGTVYCLRVAGGKAASDPIERFEADVSALATHAGGGVAVGLDGRGVVVRGGRHDGASITRIDERPAICPTCIAFLDSDTLLIALGSQENRGQRWRHDLLQRNASGSVWRYSLGSGEASCLADRLAWPAGFLLGTDGTLTVSESWRSRLLDIAPGRAPAIKLPDITGYPGRMAASDQGGAWLAVFAPRSQLVEFVLREDDYRTSMMGEVEEAFWVAPSLRPARSFLEPMQFGGLRQLGMLKPWAPTRSYGLIVGLGADGEPRSSFHSRADGRRHGITSCLELNGRLLGTSKGGDAIISIALGGG